MKLSRKKRGRLDRGPSDSKSESPFDRLVEVGIKHGKTEEEARKYAAKKLKLNELEAVLNDYVSARVARGDSVIEAWDNGLQILRLDGKIISFGHFKKTGKLKYLKPGQEPKYDPKKIVLYKVLGRDDNVWVEGKNKASVLKDFNIWKRLKEKGIKFIGVTAGGQAKVLQRTNADDAIDIRIDDEKALLIGDVLEGGLSARLNRA